jgi:hypothetical protein
MDSIAQQKAPRVFISYSYDSNHQIDRVLGLSNRLRQDGIDCNIDQYEQSPSSGWYRWMMKEITGSDFVLVICTPQYHKLFLANEGNEMSMGVTWEGSVITGELYSRRGKDSKYIPIIFGKQDESFIPYVFSGSRYDLDDQNGYQLLYRHITNQPEVIKPKLGELQKLPPKELRGRVQVLTLPEKADIQKKEYCNLPHKNYNEFIGRKEKIAELMKRISPESRPYVHVIRGIGGVGKTALAVEVAYQCWENRKNKDVDGELSIPTFDAIIYTSSKATELINAQVVNRPGKDQLLTDVFRVIADVLDEPTITQIRAKEQEKKVKEVLAKKTTLLIVDNMENIAEKERALMISFLNNVPTSTQVIITTRDFLGFEEIQIDSLTEQESYRLLDSQAKSKNIDTKTGWKNFKKQIYKRFGGIPVALIYAVGKRLAGYSFAEIVEPKKVIAEDLVRFCFESSVAPIRGTRAYDILMSMTFFRDPPCRDALIKVAGLTDGDIDTIDAIAKLQQLSLIIEKKGRYSTLSLTHQYTLLELGKDENDDFQCLARERWYKWYLNFTKQYGCEDWEGWRSRYDRLDVEWKNIESVLNWYAEKAEWTKVSQLWQNVDNYADLSKYWEDRHYWWKLLGNNLGNAEKVKALSEKGFTLTLMGTEHYGKAEEYLNKAWGLCENVDNLGRAAVANHQAVLAKVRGNYDKAHEWLNEEEKLLQTCDIRIDYERERKRYQIRNLYYQAETNYLQNKIDLAKNELERTIELTREEGVNWQRFRNYARNILAEIHVQQGDLGCAESLLRSGFSSATQARENRRIALYQATYAKFYLKLADRARMNDLQAEAAEFVNSAKEFANKALKVFTEELMLAEKDSIMELIASLDCY